LGLNEALDRSCNVLSGGERTKLVLISKKLVGSSKINIFAFVENNTANDNFVLSPPQTLEALEMFMNKYPGIILFTSHDTRFVKHVSDKKWGIVFKLYHE
jgi:macrolide transport system ATP-binding/permease protein